ncbi:MAG: hypothetical protein KIT54_08720 [Phycisphaeraceae bacterium]|nr:hypothetical protein [Phycisphaeraceae bacterium]
MLERPTWPTVIVRWRPLRWLDKPLSWVCWVRPRLLSSYVKSTPVAFRGSRVERVQFWLWRLQSPRGSVGGALVLAAAMVTVALLLGRLGLAPLLGGQDDIQGMAVAMGVTAGYCGALFGFMQAVAVFAVQLRTHQDDSVRPLSPLIARKYLTFILLAAIASVTIANLVLALAAPLVGPSPGVYGAMTWIDIVAVPGVTLAALWYLAAVVSDAGSDDMEMAIPVITMAMRDQLARDARHERLLNAYGHALNAARIEYNPFSGTRLARSGKHTGAIDLPRSGVAIDADCHRLHRLGMELKVLSGHPKASVDLLVGQAFQEGKAFVLQWDQGGLEPETKVPSSIHSCAKSVFIVSRTGRAMPAGQVRQFLGRLEAVLKKIAREGRHVELEERLANLGSIRDAWLGMIQPGTKPPERIRLMRTYDKFAGPLELDLHDIAMAAAQSGDPPTVEEVANYLMQSAFACKYAGQIRLMAAHLDVAVYLYYRCVHSEPLREAVGKRLDSSLGSLFLLIRPDLHADEEVSEAELAAVHDAILSFTLALVRAAIRYNDTKHAEWFAGRIFGDRLLSDSGQIDWDDGPVADGYKSRTQYAAMLLLGWSLNVLKHVDASESAAAKRVFDGMMPRLASPERLVALWELYRGASPYEAPIDERLGTQYWEIRDWDREQRTGIPEVTYGHDDWIRLGLRAGLLMSSVRYIGETEKLFANRPKRGIWDSSAERAALEALVQESNLGVPESEREKRVNHATGIIRARERAGKSAYLRYVLENTLSRTRIEQYRAEALRSYRNCQKWINAMVESGVGSGRASRTITATGVNQATYREYLLDDNNWDPGIGGYAGELVARYEASKLVGTIADHAPRAYQPGSLADLPESIREARQDLQTKGYDANVLVLPRANRIANSVFDMPSWQVPGQGEYGGASLGQWEGLLVLRCPYDNSNHALLLDTRKLLTTAHRDGETQPTIEIIEGRDDPELKKAYEAAEKALESGGELPDSQSIHIVTRMVAPPPLAIADINAALAIDLRPAAGYVLVEGAELFHRPGCERIEQGEQARQLHLPEDEQRKPCEHCQPNEWDHEAERQQWTRIEPTATDSDTE